MKPFSFFKKSLLLACLAAIAMAGCKKDKAVECEKNSLHATINGAHYQLDSFQVGSSNGLIQILAEGDQNGNPKFDFQIPEDVVEGPIDLALTLGLVFTPPSGGFYVLRSGAMEVTGHDKKKRVLTATFEFTTEPTDYVVTGGSLCVNY